MRILLVNGSAYGGSAVSAHQLAARLTRLGHDVVTIATRRSTGLPIARRRRWGKVLDRVGRIPQAVRRRIRWAGPSRRHDGGPHPTPRPDLLVRRLLRRSRFDVAVAVSQERRDWARLRRVLAEWRVPTVLLIHEASSVDRVRDPGPPADLVVTNAEVHTAAVTDAGIRAVTVPSVVEPPATEERRSKVVLFVNPVPGYGLDRAWSLARALPDVRFAFVESWTLRPLDRWLLARGPGSLRNVEIRRRQPIDDLYRDTAVLLVPYLDGNSPRVVAEARSLGIPVLANRTAGLEEANGGDGVLLDPKAPDSDWELTLAALHSAHLGGAPEPDDLTASLAEARRRAQGTALRFEATLAGVVRGRPATPDQESGRPTAPSLTLDRG